MAPRTEMQGLGSYMRAVGRHLKTDNTLRCAEAAKYAHSDDVPYAFMVLLRLELRGIAQRVLVHDGDTYDLGFVRGYKWHEAAAMYNWEEDE